MQVYMQSRDVLRESSLCLMCFPYGFRIKWIGWNTFLNFWIFQMQRFGHFWYIERIVHMNTVLALWLCVCVCVSIVDSLAACETERQWQCFSGYRLFIAMAFKHNVQHRIRFVIYGKLVVTATTTMPISMSLSLNTSSNCYCAHRCLCVRECILENMYVCVFKRVRAKEKKSAVLCWRSCVWCMCFGFSLFTLYFSHNVGWLRFMCEAKKSYP